MLDGQNIRELLLSFPHGLLNNRNGAELLQRYGVRLWTFKTKQDDYVPFCSAIFAQKGPVSH